MNLYPCPFCGGKSYIVKHSYGNNIVSFTPTCSDGDCCGSAMSQYFETEQEAMVAWNKRNREHWKEKVREAKGT